MGIPVEHLSRVFDPYFTTKQTGRGLGLSTSHSIVKNHGGHIRVESVVGRGTTFHVYLPAATGAAVSTESEKAQFSRGHGRVLVMDDDESVRTLAVRALRSAGYEVESAVDGSEAIEMYRKARDESVPFDVVAAGPDGCRRHGGRGSGPTAARDRSARQGDRLQRILDRHGYGRLRALRFCRCRPEAVHRRRPRPGRGCRARGGQQRIGDYVGAAPVGARGGTPDEIAFLGPPPNPPPRSGRGRCSLRGRWSTRGYGRRQASPPQSFAQRRGGTARG